MLDFPTSLELEEGLQQCYIIIEIKRGGFDYATAWSIDD